MFQNSTQKHECGNEAMASLVIYSGTELLVPGLVCITYDTVRTLGQKKHQFVYYTNLDTHVLALRCRHI